MDHVEAGKIVSCVSGCALRKAKEIMVNCHKNYDTIVNTYEARIGTENGGENILLN